MSQYPVIRIPGEIQRTQEAMPPVPSSFIDPKIPAPGKEPQPLNKELMILAGSALGIVSFVVAFSNVFWSLSLLVMGGAAIAWSSWKQWQSYPERRSQWERQVREYEFWKIERPKRLRQYELMVQEAHKPERVIEYRKEQLKLLLSRTIPHDGTGSTATRGYSEKEFFKYLSRYFPHKIYTGLTINIPNYQYPYTADFAYIDFQTSLYIDVEIDEPYVYNSGEPRHFVGSSTDEKRDRAFLNRGWLVIRFAEEQVCRWPDSCCKIISTVVSQVLGDSLPPEFTNIANLPPIDRWTLTQAQLMAKQNYRDRYVK